MKEKIYDELEDAIIDILVKHQDALGIDSGDEIGDSVLDRKYEESLDFIASYLDKTLRYQMWTNGIGEYPQDI